MDENGGMMRLPLADYMRQLEASRGLPAGYLSRTQQIESSGGKNLVNPNSSARGNFQFIGKTAKAYGVDVNDPYSGARGAADYAADNAKLFKQRLGATPTAADLYGMHQQGGPGYVSLVNGKAPGGAAQALNGGAGMTAEQFRNKITSMFNNAPSPGANQGQGPTVAAAAAANAPMAGAQGPVRPMDAGVPVAQPAAMPAPTTFNGGIVGLLQGKDYTGDGAAKDTMGRLADFTGSKAFTSGIAGIGAALAPTPSAKPMVLQPVDPNDEVKPQQMSLLQMIQAGRRGAMGV